MLKGTSITGLWQPLVLLALLGVAVLGLAVLRFRRDLAPGGRDGDTEPAVHESVTA
jgi:ABC-2 type transport system permease protein